MMTRKLETRLGQREENKVRLFRPDFLEKGASCIASRVLLILALTAIALAWAPAMKAQTIPTGFQEYEVIGNEQHVYGMFNDVSSGEGYGTFPPRMYSVVGVATSVDNQVIYYDQWEDGFEADIANPVQPSTLVLGDNNPSNGDARNFTSDTRLTGDQLLVGTSLIFNSDQPAVAPDIRNEFVPMPRLASDVRYDGGDRVFSSGGLLTVVHYQRPDTTLIGGSTEIISKQAVKNAFAYSVPVGTDTYTRYGGNGSAGSPFKYVYLDLVAYENGTQVFVDNKSGGTASFTLNEGQHWSSLGLIDGSAAPSVTVLEGTKISTNKPITGLIFAGGAGNYQTRFYALLPDLMHSTDFLITAPGDDPSVNGDRPLNLYIYNPNPSKSIQVNTTDTVGSKIITVPPNKVVAYTEAAGAGRAVPTDSTVRLTSSDIFWGISAYEYNFRIVDWGHSWLATKFLTKFYSISWAPGTEDPVGSYSARGTRGCDGSTPCNSLNRSPIFVSAVEDNTRVQVDFNNDGTYDRIDTNSDDVPDCPSLGCGDATNTYVINALQCLRVFDPTDYDNSGTTIVANKPVAVAYGQDSDQGEGSDPTLDLGNGIFPLTQSWLDLALTIDMTADTNHVPSTGGPVVFTLTVKSYAFGPLTSLSIYDLLPSGITYVPGTTVVTYPGGAQDTADPSTTGNRLDWTLSPNSLGTNETLTIQFTGNVASGSPQIFRNVAHADADLGAGTRFSPRASYDVVRTDVTLVKSVTESTAIPGQDLHYSLVVTNNSSAQDETAVTITDPIPAGTTFKTGSISSANGFFTGTYDPAQNAVIWTAGTFSKGATDTLSFIATVVPGATGGMVIGNTASFESAETPNFSSNSTSTTIVAPTLVLSKSGPATALNGERITYLITASNTGTGDATSVAVVDPFPANGSYVAESMFYSLDGGTFTHVTDATGDGDAGYAYGDRVELHWASLAAGSSLVFRFQVDVTGFYPAVLNNQAAVSATGLSPQDSNLLQTAIVESNLSTSTKTVVDLNGGDVVPGDTLRYTITLTESLGVMDAQGVTVTDDIPGALEAFTVVSIPSGATDLSTGAGTGAYGSGYLDIENITVPKGSSVTIVFDADALDTLNTGDTIDNSASVTDPAGPDPTPASPTLIVKESEVPSSGLKLLYMKQGTPYPLSRLAPTADTNPRIQLKNQSEQWELTPALWPVPVADLRVDGVISAPIWVRERDKNAHLVATLDYYDPATTNYVNIGSDLFIPPNHFNGFHTFDFTTAGYSHSFPLGTTFRLSLAETNNKRVRIYFDRTSRPSRVELPSTNVITVYEVTPYDAAYPLGATQATWHVNDTVYIRAFVSDPFGSFDITAARLTLIDPLGASVLTNQAMTPVYDSGAGEKYYEYSYTIPGAGPRGYWTAQVTADEGSEGTITDMGVGTIPVQLEAPVVDSPILAGASTLSGTSTEEDGTTITVYKNGSPIGTTTVSGGAWTLTSVSGLVGGDVITAKAGTGVVESPLSNAVTVKHPAPVVSSPITTLDTVISGTSASPDGTTITVYKNGVSIGITTVTGGAWTLTGVSGLLVGDDITAKAGTGSSLSDVSNTVTVTQPPSLPPIVTSPLYAGASRTILGSSVEAAGSTILVYVNGAFVGVTTVQADGTWSLPGIPLSDGQSVNATVQAPGKSVSSLSNTVVVSADSSDLTPPPVISSPVPALSTSVLGTSLPGAAVDVYLDGMYLGTTMADGTGAWTLSGVDPLPSGGILSATATLAPGGTSDWSAPVVVGPIVHLLRDDSMTDLSQPRAPLFIRQAPLDSAMDPLGANHVSNWGEGTMLQAPGTDDGDQAYITDLHSGDTDTDPTVLTDNTRVLVFYELVDNSAKTLKLSKAGGVITFTITP